MAPYVDIDQNRTGDRRYYRNHKERIKQREREKYWREHALIRSRRAALNSPARKSQAAERERLRYQAYRDIVIRAYGGHCACCGETEPMFLEIDHINGGGNAHRRKIGRSSKATYYWLIKHDFPDGFQVLCSNCNQGKKRNGGICPHQKNGQYSSRLP